jgi:hypothetical protein
MINHRIYYTEKGKRFLHARNWDEFLHRDLKVFTVERALAVLVAASLAMAGLTNYSAKLIPLGRRGFTRISQVPLYQVLGPVGVGAVLGGWGLAAVCYWKTVKFCLGKVRFVGLQGDKMSLWETKNSGFWKNYKYRDDPLSHAEGTDNWERALLTSQDPWPKGFVTSPYAALTE